VLCCHRTHRAWRRSSETGAPPVHLGPTAGGLQETVTSVRRRTMAAVVALTMDRQAAELLVEVIAAARGHYQHLQLAASQTLAPSWTRSAKLPTCWHMQGRVIQQELGMFVIESTHALLLYILNWNTDSDTRPLLAPLPCAWIRGYDALGELLDPSTPLPGGHTPDGLTPPSNFCCPITMVGRNCN
jgi:hypothetical protein